MFVVKMERKENDEMSGMCVAVNIMDENSGVYQIWYVLGF